MPNGTTLVTQAADKSKGSSNSIFPGKQTWLLEAPNPIRRENWAVRGDFIVWFGSASTEKDNYKASICPFPPHPAKPIHFVPFQLSALQPTLSPLVIFQESCRVRAKHSVAPSTPAVIGPSTSSHLTLKINREPWGLRQADWNSQSQVLFQSSGSLIWNSRFLNSASFYWAFHSAWKQSLCGCCVTQSGWINNNQEIAPLLGRQKMLERILRKNLIWTGAGPSCAVFQTCKVYSCLRAFALCSLWNWNPNISRNPYIHTYIYICFSSLIKMSLQMAMPPKFPP